MHENLLDNEEKPVSVVCFGMKGHNTPNDSLEVNRGEPICK